MAIRVNLNTFKATTLLPYVVVFHMDTGDQHWYILGCYLAPDNTLTIESVVATLKEQPWGAKLLVAGDLNVKL